MFTVTQYVGFVGGHRPIVPPNTTGLVAWYDASDVTTLTTSGTNVNAMNDKQGTHTMTLRGGGGLQPAPKYAANFKNGLSALHFGVGTSLITTPMLMSDVSSSEFPSSSNHFSAAAVALTTSTKNGAIVSLVDANTPNGFARYSLFDNSGIGGQANWFDSGDQITLTSTRTTSEWQLHAMSGTIGTQTYRLNGGEVTGSATGTKTQTSTMTAMFIGNIDDTGQSGLLTLDGYFGEARIFNKPLGTADLFKEEGYLAWKWGMQGNLPGNHPYKNEPPPP